MYTVAATFLRLDWMKPLTFEAQRFDLAAVPYMDKSRKHKLHSQNIDNKRQQIIEKNAWDIWTIKPIKPSNYM